MSHQTPKILLIGCGKMGSALAQGWVNSILRPQLIAVDRSTQQEGKTYPVIPSIEHIDPHFSPDMIVLAVKPAFAETVIENLRSVLKERFNHAALLSVMAGKSCAALAKSAGNKDFPIIRTMPNTPASIQAGMTGIYFSASVNEVHKKLAQELMQTSGEIVILPKESDLQIVTAISGSGPAYIFLLAELLQQNGIKMGLSEEVARKLSRQMIYGAGKMLHLLPEEAEQLRKNVTSPNGTTQAALDVLMNEHAWPQTITEALHAASHRAQELDN